MCVLCFSGTDGMLALARGSGCTGGTHARVRGGTARTHGEGAAGGGARVLRARAGARTADPAGSAPRHVRDVAARTGTAAVFVPPWHLHTHLHTHSPTPTHRLRAEGAVARGRHGAGPRAPAPRAPRHDQRHRGLRHTPPDAHRAQDRARPLHCRHHRESLTTHNT